MDATMTELDLARIRRRTRELQGEDIAYAAARMIAIQEVYRQQQRLQRRRVSYREQQRR